MAGSYVTAWEKYCTVHASVLASHWYVMMMMIKHTTYCCTVIRILHEAGLNGTLYTDNIRNKQAISPVEKYIYPATISAYLSNTMHREKIHFPRQNSTSMSAVCGHILPRDTHPFPRRERTSRRPPQQHTVWTFFTVKNNLFLGEKYIATEPMSAFCSYNLHPWNTAFFRVETPEYDLTVHALFNRDTRQKQSNGRKKNINHAHWPCATHISLGLNTVYSPVRCVSCEVHRQNEQTSRPTQSSSAASQSESSRPNIQANRTLRELCPSFGC